MAFMSPKTGTLTAAAAATLSSGAAASTGIVATTSMSAAFMPTPGKSVNVRLRGPFSATVRVIISYDNGVSWDPFTVGGLAYGVFTTFCCEQITAFEDTPALVALECTVYASGTVSYRLGH